MIMAVFYRRARSGLLIQKWHMKIRFSDMPVERESSSSRAAFISKRRRLLVVDILLTRTGCDLLGLSRVLLHVYSFCSDVIPRGARGGDTRQWSGGEEAWKWCIRPRSLPGVASFHSRCCIILISADRLCKLFPDRHTQTRVPSPATLPTFCSLTRYTSFFFFLQMLIWLDPVLSLLERTKAFLDQNAESY